MKKLKVGFLTNISGIGGGETSLINLLEQLKEYSHSPVLFCPKGELFNWAQEKGIVAQAVELPNVHLIARIVPQFSSSAVFHLMKIIRNNSIDILHAESLAAIYFGGLASYAMRIPCVATYHGFWKLKSPIAHLALNAFCRRIYPVSESVAQDLYPVIRNKSKLKVVPLGVNPVFNEALPTKDEARTRLGLSSTIPLIMQIARFQEIKGQKELAEALDIIVHEKSLSHSLRLAFVGDVIQPANDAHIAYKREVRQYIRERDLEEFVHFLGHRRDIPLLMRAADVIVVPSHYESFGMVVIEAMFVGTPVIATNVGGPATIIKHEQTGLLVPPRNPVLLASSIKRLLTNPVFSHQLANAAKRDAQRNFAPGIRCKQMLIEYLNLLTS